MKKLNNKGWGLSTFIAFIVFFFFVILLVTFVADKAGMGKDGGFNDDEDDNVMIIN